MTNKKTLNVIWNEENEFNDYGVVISIGDGVAKVSGLDNIQVGELVTSSNNISEIALNLEHDLRWYNCLWWITLIIIGVFFAWSIRFYMQYNFQRVSEKQEIEKFYNKWCDKKLGWVFSDTMWYACLFLFIIFYLFKQRLLPYIQVNPNWFDPEIPDINATQVPSSCYSLFLLVLFQTTDESNATFTLNNFLTLFSFYICLFTFIYLINRTMEKYKELLMLETNQISAFNKFIKMWRAYGYVLLFDSIPMALFYCFSGTLFWSLVRNFDWISSLTRMLITCLGVGFAWALRAYIQKNQEKIALENELTIYYNQWCDNVLGIFKKKKHWFYLIIFCSISLVSWLFFETYITLNEHEVDLSLQKKILNVWLITNRLLVFLVIFIWITRIVVITFWGPSKIELQNNDIDLFTDESSSKAKMPENKRFISVSTSLKKPLDPWVTPYSGRQCVYDTTMGQRFKAGRDLSSDFKGGFN